MKANILSAILLFFLCTGIVRAQNDQSFKSISVIDEKDVAFDKTVDYLMAKEIFIQAMDKKAGFIQAKVFIKSRNALSNKTGERRTMTFILRSIDQHTKITLNIYREDGHYGSSSSYSYEDKGIVEEASVYHGILNDLQKTLDKS